MRLITLNILLILGLCCSSTKNSTFKSGELEGTWVPIKQEMGGKILPEAAFENQKLIISDSTYTFTAESVDKGVIKYRDGKMDIHGIDGANAGKHFTALYKYENELLTICYNLLGDSYPDAFETKSKPLLFLCIFKREMTK